jgi:hypothetical protein
MSGSMRPPVPRAEVWELRSTRRRARARGFVAQVQPDRGLGLWLISAAPAFKDTGCAPLHHIRHIRGPDLHWPPLVAATTARHRRWHCFFIVSIVVGIVIGSGGICRPSLLAVRRWRHRRWLRQPGRLAAALPDSLLPARRQNILRGLPAVRRLRLPALSRMLRVLRRGDRAGPALDHPQEVTGFSRGEVSRPGRHKNHPDRLPGLRAGRDGWKGEENGPVRPARQHPVEAQRRAAGSPSCARPISPRVSPSPEAVSMVSSTTVALLRAPNGRPLGFPLSPFTKGMASLPLCAGRAHLRPGEFVLWRERRLNVPAVLEQIKNIGQEIFRLGLPTAIRLLTRPPSKQPRCRLRVFPRTTSSCASQPRPARRRSVRPAPNRILSETDRAGAPRSGAPGQQHSERPAPPLIPSSAGTPRGRS